MAKKLLPVIKLRFVTLAISVVLLVAGVVGFVVFDGFNLGIDFDSGLSQQVQILSGNASIDDVRLALNELGNARVQTLGTEADQTYQIRLGVEEGDTQSSLEEKVLVHLGSAFGTENVVSLGSNYVGPKFSSSLITGSVLAVLVASILILMYVWFRFRFAYALSSVIALFHDIILMLAFIAIFQFEVSSTTIAAVLTIIGYSLNNSIVIFDRVRENVKIVKDAPFTTMIDRSITQSLSRTILTSLTTILAILPLAIFASGDIQLFAFELVFGIIIGTYSSNFLAPSLLYWINKGSKKKITDDKKAVAAQAQISEVPVEEHEDATAKQPTSTQEIAIPAAERKLKGKRQDKR